MKGPSLQAIRKFKEQQEQKKRDEEEKRIKEKISTLEHRAAQGDRKAKTELRKITDEQKKPPPVDETRLKTSKHVEDESHKKQASVKTKKEVKVESSFEELMRLAKQNKNEIKKPEPQPALKTEVPKSKSNSKEHNLRPKAKSKHEELQPKSKMMRVEASSSNFKSQKPFSTSARTHPISAKPQPVITRPPSNPSRQPPPISQRAPAPSNRLPSMSHRPVQMNYRQPPHRRTVDYDEYDDEDDYESDGFVVDEEDDEVGENVSQTIRSLFRYDKRRCDLREEELDRQYRAIGKVSTFEDLEREERRASRIAAAEDARAQREEEEKKRRKQALKLQSKR